MCGGCGDLITYLTSIGIVEALYQLDNGALATPTGPHQSNSLSMLDLQVQSIEDLRGAWLSHT